MNTKLDVDFSAAADLPALYGLLDQVKMKNGWAKPTPSLYPQPKHTFMPAHWRYRDAHAALHEAGRLVDPAHAERRNLIMANPIAGNDYPTVKTLVGAYQMVMPDEAARSHRHTPNAMRVVLESAEGMYTIVDGKKIPMARGDVLLTPNWCWHGHANESGKECYWADILDAPLVQYLEPMFFEQHADFVEKTDIVDAASPMRFAYADYLPRLLAQPEVQSGVRQLLLGPATLSTFDRTAVSIGRGASWTVARETPNVILMVVEGEGTSRIGDAEFHWGPGDMMAVPCWNEHRHAADSDAVLVRMSDAPVMAFAGWLRTQAQAHAAR
jgi:gentisate 1,2-dioxygenase